MKKLFAVLLTVLVAASACFAASASGGFVSSPSNNLAPEVVDFEKELEDCAAVIICTAYADRKELVTETREKLEQAYETIISVDDISELTEDIEDVVEKIGVLSENLAVSDMFDISASGCDVHENHGRFTVKIKPTSLKNFVALLHYYDNKWNVVEDVTFDEEGNLSFVEDNFSPFAIIVDISEDEPACPWIYILIAICALIIFFVIWKKSKKDKKEAPTA